MFGLEPDLLCERCAKGIRRRLAPRATGRLVNSFGGHPTPVTTAIVGFAVVLFVLVYFVYRQTPIAQVPAWILQFEPSISARHSISGGEWWRLLTTALLHGGPLHILFDGMWMWSLGKAVESTRGPGRYLLLFAGSAVFASAAQVYVGHAGGIGLSGVIYALAAFLWMRRRVDGVAATVMNPSTSRILGVWWVLCWVLPLNIGNWAHTGGIAWGLAAGWLSLKRAPVRYPGLAALGAVTVFAAWLVSTGHVL
jgi:GlpG protein